MRREEERERGASEIKNWMERRLDEIGTTQTGATPKTSERDNYGDFIPFVKPSDFNPDGSLDYEAVGLSEKGLSEARKVPAGSALMVCIGATIGKSGHCEREIATNQQINALTPFEGISHRFIYYQMLTENFQRRVLLSSGQATLPIINKSRWSALTVVVPPTLGEQRRIVGILDEAFEGIATAKVNAEKNRQNARALFESHLQSVFTQRGKGWEEKGLAEICQRVSVGHVGPTSQFYCDPADGIPFLRSQNVRPGRLDWDGIQYVTKEFHKRLKKSQLRTGDLLFVRVGANRGDCCAVHDDVAELNCANIVFARPTQGNPAYLERYCQSPPGRAQLLGMTTGSAQGVINTSSVAELVVPFPPLPEQKTIVANLDALSAETDRLVSIYQQKVAALDELKKSLLQQAFNGDL